MPTSPTTATTRRAPSSGFLTSVDEAQLLETAARHGFYVDLHCHPGSSLVEGVPVGRAWRTGADFTACEGERIRGVVARTPRVGYERTAADDVGFGLRQLTDVANEALSPGINDPTTAVHALGHVPALLCRMAGRDVGPVVPFDENDVPRVRLLRPTLAEHVEEAIAQSRRYGSGDPEVMIRLMTLLEELAHHRVDAPMVRDQLRRLEVTIARGDFDDVERERSGTVGRRVRDALANRANDGH